MPKSWYAIKAASGPALPSVDIYDEIGAWGVRARDFISDLKNVIGDAPEFNLFISSPGGDVFEGLAIYNSLKFSGKKINVIVMGIAASMASIVAMAGTTRTMPENAMLMVHNALSVGFSATDAEQHREMADLLDKIDNSLVGIYVTNSGQSEEAVRAVMRANTFMSAKEALDLGFITAISDPVRAQARFDLDLIPADVRDRFQAVARIEDRLPPADIQAAVVEAGLTDYVAHFATDVNLKTLPQVQAAVGNAKDVLDLCAMVGKPEAASAFIRSRALYADARKALAEGLAAADAHVDTSQPTKAVQASAKAGVDPTALWAQINAMQPTARRSQP